MDDGMTARIIKLIKQIYGEENFRENMEFIAEALGKKTNESAEETLNRYLNDGFYADHLKVYQKRPIYWLFTSGKNGGFKCMVYMHRYNEDTLARINSKYFLPESTRLKHDLEDIAQRIAGAEGSERVRLEKERQRIMACYQEALSYETRGRFAVSSQELNNLPCDAITSHMVVVAIRYMIECW